MIDLKEIQKRIDETPPEVWEKIWAEMDAKEKELDDKCANGDHQGTLSNPTFSGADIYWRCSRCGGTSLQIGGNRPMTI